LEQLQDNISEMNQVSACKHCHELVITAFKNKQGDFFCCSGCMHVYSIINKLNLNEFYAIQESSGEFTKPIDDLPNKSFAYLDDITVEKKYVIYENNQKTIEFYIEGIHCLACIWLIEKITGILDTVISTRLNIEKSVVTIALQPSGRCSQVASTLNSLGYTPTPISGNTEAKELQRKEEQNILLRIGVAGACSMNIMLYSFGIYAGAEQYFLQIFSHLSLILSIPVITYSAWPFYKSAYSAIRNKKVNLDIPLSFALIIGFSLSLYYTLVGSAVNYFDSISTLVLLILLSRYLLKKAHQNSLKATNLSSLFGASKVVKVDGKRNIELEEDQLTVNDTLLVETGHYIPADGVVTSGNSSIDTSSLTGESKPMLVTPGSYVHKGTINQGAPIKMKAKALREDTVLGKILINVENNLKTRPKLLQLTDKISGYFIVTILSCFVLSLGILYFANGLDTALQRSLAFIIVTCPCALGLATPLAFSRALKQAAKLGIIIKSDHIIEEISQVKNLFFDKTGTLTHGKFQVSSFEVINHSKISFNHNDILFSLEKDSQHPIAKSLVRYLSSQSIEPLKTVYWSKLNETLGKGITAHYQGSTYSIESSHSNSADELELLLKENDTILVKVKMIDTLRPESSKLISWLNNNSFKLNIISGDTTHRVIQTCKEIGPYFNIVRGDLTPQGKADILSHHHNSLMIGDGANDSVAFSKSNISIAVQGSVEMSLKVSDVYFSQTGLTPLKNLITLANETILIVKRNLVISSVYNISGAILALMGFIGPLEAAILMPASSLTVLLTTVYGTKKTRSLKRGCDGNY
jgi:Cu2+-exporting ATPase/Cu+-exporting ATPase